MTGAPPDLPEACHSLMERSPVPMAELEGAGHVVRYANPAFCRLVGKPRQALVGHPFAEAAREEDRCLALLDRVYRTGQAETHTEPEHTEFHPAWCSYAMWPVLDAEQRPAGVMMQVTETTPFRRQVGAMNEALLISSVRQHELTEAAEKLNEQLEAGLTERNVANAALRQSEAKYRTLFDASDQGFCIVEKLKAEAGQPSDFRYLTANPAFALQTGAHDVVGKTVREAFPGEQQELFDAILATGKPVRFERHFVTRGRVLEHHAFRVEDGTGSRVAVIVTDITARKRHEERQRMLIDELNHRVKNTLATVQSLAMQTFRDDDHTEHARREFEGRLMALARAHDILTQESWEGAPLAKVVEEAIEPYRAEGFTRFDISGSSLWVPPKYALALAMALHELCTNAVKYGALSNGAGRVRIAWDVAGTDAARKLRMRWTESGGPSVVRPSRRGFGSRLVERGLKHDLGGEVRIDFAGSGVVCSIEAPLRSGEREQ